MMTPRNLMGLIGTGIAIAIWLVAVLTVAVVGLHTVAAVMVFMSLCLLYGWMLLAFFHYRQGRQEELLHLLATIVDARVPLGPALWAYLDDRPGGTWRESWVFVLLLFVVPGYYWFRHRRHSYDSKVAQVAYRVDRGFPLSDALQDVPGILPRDAILAVAVGESTGRLSDCLRKATATRLAPVWLEVLPRVLYPLLTLIVITVVLSFWSIFVLPRIQRIFWEFNLKLPEGTQQVLDIAGVLGGMLGFLFLGFFGVVLLILVLIFNSHLRWYFPGLGRLYQMHVQSRVLRMLSILIDANKPVPEAVGLLVEAEYGAAVVRGRLRQVRERSERGEPLATSLNHCGLLPRSMVPLVQSAERVGNLSWALAELAESRSTRLVRILKRGSMLLAPVVVCAMGALVAVIVIGIFLPLVEMLMWVS
jgi:general secretion pathway protein F